MYILKNAWTSIVRNKGRNLLIAIIIVVISCAVTITLAIRNSANSLIESYSSAYDVEATIGVNRESMKEQMNIDEEDDDSKEERIENMQDAYEQATSLTLEDIENYGDSDYVLSYYYKISVGVDSDDIQAASTTFESDDENNEDGDKKMAGMPSSKEEFTNISSGDFTLVGYSTLEAMEDFISGTYTITDGQVSSDMSSYDCVINSELATLNNIEVGDEITLSDPDDEDNTITLVVSGIFEENESSNSMSMFTSSVNTIITNAEVVSQFAANDEDMQTSLSPTFILVSLDAVEDFEKELKNKGLSDSLALSTNLDDIEQSTSTISNVKTFATTFLIITLIIGGIVLFVINMINIRERKYEIGVLRTIGMKKSKLTLQFLSELLIVGIVSLSIGAGIGALSSVSISNKLLESEISSSTQQKEDVRGNFGNNDIKEFNSVNGVADVEAFTSIDAAVNLVVLAQLFAIGIALILVSSLASLISIQKFSPLNILKERS